MVRRISNLRIATLILASILCACEEKDRYVDTYEYTWTDSDADTWLAEQNAWIFHTMKTWYFWNDQLLDSCDYDFSLEPLLFFEQMLVPEDRFSYCALYEGYAGTRSAQDTEVEGKYVFDVSGRRVGYLAYSSFGASATLMEPFRWFHSQEVTDFIIDLRGNPGGAINTCNLLASLLVPREHIGDVFCTYKYNYTQALANNHVEYLQSSSFVQENHLDIDRLVVLVNGGSASCSELFINSLRPYRQVVVVGDTTVGKDVGMRVFASPRYKYELSPITFRTYNAKGDSVPMTGIVPDYYVASSKQVCDSTERALALALELVVQP